MSFNHLITTLFGSCPLKSHSVTGGYGSSSGDLNSLLTSPPSSAPLFEIFLSSRFLLRLDFMQFDLMLLFSCLYIKGEEG